MCHVLEWELIAAPYVLKVAGQRMIIQNEEKRVRLKVNRVLSLTMTADHALDLYSNTAAAPDSPYLDRISIVLPSAPRLARTPAGFPQEEEEEGMGREDRFPLWEAALGAGVAAVFAASLVGVYLSMPDSDYSFLKLPRNLHELQILTGHLENYTSDYTVQVLIGYCDVYIFMQTFMIPGTIFMSLLVGALFGQLRGVALVVFAASAGASSCYFLSKLIGKPLVFVLWPDKLTFFQKQVAKRREKLLNYMLFLRVNPTLPNTFINLASPIVDVPFHTFLLATLIGLIPAAYVTVRARIALGELTSLSDLYDTQSVALLFLIGVVSSIRLAEAFISLEHPLVTKFRHEKIAYRAIKDMACEYQQMLELLRKAPFLADGVLSQDPLIRLQFHGDDQILRFYAASQRLVLEVS
ncbi:putative membrane protein [Hordeum vulgare]|nr:putative membrane protein [Hordeum vulgare]